MIWTFLSLLILFLFLFYLFLLWRSKRQLKKLRRNYVQEGNKSRKTEQGREFRRDRTSGGWGKGSGTASGTADRPTDSFASESRSIQLLPVKQPIKPEPDTKKHWPKFK